jgi:hypothetical protein
MPPEFMKVAKEKLAYSSKIRADGTRWKGGL